MTAAVAAGDDLQEDDHDDADNDDDNDDDDADDDADGKTMTTSTASRRRRDIRATATTGRKAARVPDEPRQHTGTHIHTKTLTSTLTHSHLHPQRTLLHTVIAWSMRTRYRSSGDSLSSIAGVKWLRLCVCVRA
jgi:hypothetical protein